MSLLAPAFPALCQDLVAVAPQAAKVVYEDARVRVVRLQVAPRASIPMHDRPSRIVIPLATNEVQITRADGRTSISRSVAGTVGWSGPGKRSFVNLDAPLDNIVVELKQAADPAKALANPPSPPPARYLQDRFHRWLFENQYVRVYDVRIPPGATTDFHVHGFDSVIVRTSGGLTATQAPERPWETANRYEPGSVEFTADARHPRTHRVRNDGPAEYHVIIVQFLQ